MTTPIYTRAELRYRPIEQVVEQLTCCELAEAAGIPKDTAMMVKRYRGGALSDEQVSAVRRFLESERR